MSDLAMSSTSRRLEWDKTGTRTYRTGVDRGAMYLMDGTYAAWNGLISVEEGAVREKQSFYLDGVKYLEQITPGDFSGKLKAFTYPEEFDRALGIVSAAPGLDYYDQPPEMFNLTYRTRLGDDIQGTDAGYTIHLLYNLVAEPDSVSYETLGAAVKPAEFGFGLSGTPPSLTGFRPTVHISLDSTETSPDILIAIENILYGTDESEPRFPSIGEINALYGAIGALIIVDNGDGTWTAIDMGDNYITMLDDTTFEIEHADAEFLDISTYEISTTNEPL